MAEISQIQLPNDNTKHDLRDPSKLPLSGGTMIGQIQRGANGSSGVKGRDNAVIRLTNNTEASYQPMLSMKTNAGSGELGRYTSNILHLNYITDTNYNSNTNTQTVDIQFKTDGSITAPKFVGALSGNATTATTATTANAVAGNNITSKPSTFTPSSHNHAASNITSGTLAINRIPTITVAKGGTGATTAAAARTNLGITPANIGAATIDNRGSGSNAGSISFNTYSSVELFMLVTVNTGVRYYTQVFPHPLTVDNKRINICLSEGNYGFAASGTVTSSGFTLVSNKTYNHMTSAAVASNELKIISVDYLYYY